MAVTFISKRAAPRYVIVPANIEMVETTRGKMPLPTKGVSIQFKVLAKPMHSKLPAADGMALGVLKTDKAAKECGLTEEEVHAFLMSHKSYGVDFIDIQADGEEILPPDQIIVQEGDEGQWYCKACDQHLRSTPGKLKHEVSQKHVAALQDMFERLGEDLEDTV
jgi:hypothetical protein